MKAVAAPLKGAELTGATAGPPRATSRALKASLQVEVAPAGKAPAQLSRPVPEEELAARVHRAVGVGSRGMTATPGGGRPSRAPVPMSPETCLAAADRDQTAPMVADTGPPATSGTAALTRGDAPSAPMGTAGPPAPAQCLGESKPRVP